MTELTFPEEVEWHDPLPRNIPRQTYTPAVLALGLTLFVWGALTSWIIGASGFVLIWIAVGGWARELILQSLNASAEQPIVVEGDSHLEHA